MQFFPLFDLSQRVFTRRHTRILQYVERYNLILSIVRVNCLLELGNLEAALTVLDQIATYPQVSDNENLAEIHALKSNLYVTLGNSSQALHQINKAIELLPNDKVFKHERLNVYLKVKNYEQALADIKQMRIEEPDNLHLLLSESVIYCIRKQWDQALQVIEQGLNIDPTHAGLLTNKAGVMFYANRYDESLALLNQALQHDPDFILALKQRAVLLYDMGRYEQAERDYRKAARYFPQDSVLLYCYAGCLNNLGHYSEALAQTNYLIANSKPEQPWDNLAEIYVLHTELLFKLQHYEQALVSSGQVLELKPNVAGFFVNHSCILRHLGQNNKALDYINWALALEPEKLKTYLVRAELYLLLNRVDSAQQDVELVLQHQPNSTRALELAATLAQCEQRSRLYFSQPSL